MESTLQLNQFRAEDYERYRKLGEKHLIQPNLTRTAAYNPKTFKLFVKEDGCRVTDIKGKTYLDAFGSLMYKNIGYGRKDVIDAIYRQLQMLSSCVGTSPNIPQIELASKLAAITPGDLSVVFYGNNGGDAVETSVKIARHYQRLCGFANRYKVICRRREYHGTNLGTMALGRPLKPNYSTMVDDFQIYGPFMPGVIHVTPPHCYRCEYDLTYPDCKVKCARDIESVLLSEGPESVAAFLATPISANSLCDVPPAEYWPIVRRICDKYGIVLIVDCVVTGFGRTGKMFGIEHFGINPDIMAVAKGMNSGYLPLSASIISSRIADAFEPNNTFSHDYTFGGHPASCAAALENIDIIEREKLVEHSSKVGKYLLKKLENLKEHPIVGDVRGIGLFCAVEYVRDKRTKEPFDDELTRRMNRRLLDLGLISRTRNSSTSLLPPLIFTRSDADEAVNIIEKVITETEKEILKKRRH
ncbi:MAG: aspartate aminotransferase family protein [Syntrophales bacterium]|jgi:adenosylmethionine-8-amino-7-oxononanoate aminotransferase|nr:aspartate aminotransferase family protein [Syntrophales bacterium]